MYLCNLGVPDIYPRVLWENVLLLVCQFKTQILWWWGRGGFQVAATNLWFRGRYTRSGRFLGLYFARYFMVLYTIACLTTNLIWNMDRKCRRSITAKSPFSSHLSVFERATYYNWQNINIFVFLLQVSSASYVAKQSSIWVSFSIFFFYLCYFYSFGLTRYT